MASLQNLTWTDELADWDTLVGTRVGEAAHPGLTKTRRGRSKGKFLEVVSFNGNAWNSITDFMYANASPTRVVAAQEHRLRGDAWSSAVESTRKKGWKIMSNEAANTAQAQDSSSLCTSVGALVAVPNTLGTQYPYGSTTWDASPKEHPGRIGIAWVDAFGGLYVVSLYLHTSEGWSARNTELVQHLAQQLAILAAPWVVAGDYNMEPDTFEKSHCWAALGAIFVVSPDPGGTCRVQGTQRAKSGFQTAQTNLTPIEG